MTFTTTLKEEISKNDFSLVEARYELEGFVKAIGKKQSELIFTLENASVARRIYKDIKMVFGINANVIIRIQKRFRVKQIYILTIKEKIDLIKEALEINNLNICLENEEEKIAFLQGAFLAIGNISNPQTSGYHLEFICNNLMFAKTIQNLLLSFNLNAKIVDRGYKNIVYLKSSENISDLLKLFKATSAMFFFEDIRIYRDHKNMVNRLNNCELSNQTKSIQTGLKQLEDIKYLKNNDLIDILDDKTKIVIEAREKYPESSLTELAEIISLEYNYRIGKSGVNHHFIKMTNIIKRHRSNNENQS
ncbi:MAG: DNA-binding protein WhiA [Firmicutes bacterium]|nr:DNA-binding protein WhiA [Bacillota bacterium]